MSGLAFDSLAYARRLEAAGFSREQAEALALEQTKLVDERLATKADILDLQVVIENARAGLSRDVEALRLSTEAKLAGTKADILKWIAGAIGLQTLTILGAVIALARVPPH